MFGRKCCCQVRICDQYLFGQVWISVSFSFYKKLSDGCEDVFIQFTRWTYVPKAICPRDNFSVKPHLSFIPSLLSHKLGRRYQGFHTTTAKPLLPSMLQFDNPLFGFRLGISHGWFIPEMKDPSLLAASALCSAQKLSGASLAAMNRVPNNVADQSTGCHHPSEQIPPSQPCSISSAKTAAINRFKELVCLKSKTLEHVHSTLLGGVLIKVGTSTLQIYSFLYI